MVGPVVSHDENGNLRTSGTISAYQNGPTGVVSSKRLSDMSDREFSIFNTQYAHKLGLDADASKYQRAMKDLKKAGLNPRLLLEGGSASANGVNASSSYSLSNSQDKSTSSGFNLSSAALVALLGLILKAMI